MHQDLDIENWKLGIESEDSILLDVRTPQEWSMGIQKDAQMIDYYDSTSLLSFIQELDQSKSYFVYCKAGGRSLHVCEIMQQMGFLNTRNLLGGMMDWTGEVVPASK